MILFDAALFEMSIICIVSFTNNEAFAGKVIVYPLLAVFAKIQSFTVALKVVLTSRVVTPAVPVVVIYLPMVLSFSYCIYAVDVSMPIATAEMLAPEA